MGPGGYAIILVLFLVIVIGVIAYLVYRKKHHGGGGGMNTGNNAIAGKDYTIEKTYNASIPTPSTPYLYNFENSQSVNLGKPWCQPTYYAVRLVNFETGEYGPLSQWIGPISSKQTTFPCKPNSTTCKFTVPTRLNKITIGSDTTYDRTQLLMNLHQQVGVFDPQSDGDIIGYVMPGSNIGFNSLYLLPNGC